MEDKWAELESLFGTLPLTLNQRSEISGYGLVFGAVVAKASGAICVHCATYQFQDTIRRISTLLRELQMVPSDLSARLFNFSIQRKSSNTSTLT